MDEREEFEERERQRRLAVLHALAEQASQANQARSAPAAQAASATTSSRLRRSAQPRARTLLISVALIVVLAVAGFGAYQLALRKGGSPTTIPTALTLDLTKDSLACPVSMAWSPDNARLAVMARTGRCDRPSNSDVTVLAIYDVHTGRLLRRVEPDGLLATFSQTGRTANAQWAPDGSTLVMDAVIFPKANSGQPSMGLLLIPATGGAPRFIQGPTYDPDAPQAQLIWDVAGGKMALVSPKPLPLALTYCWTADGRIIPNQPMPNGSASGFVPGCATSLSRWRSGTIENMPAVDKDGNPQFQTPPVAWFLVSSLPSWSPDGRYYTEPLLMTRLIATGAPSSPITTGYCADNQFDYFTSICAQTGTAPPDPAFAAALTAAQAGHTITDSNGISYGTQWASDVSVDWRPDGKALAAIFPADRFQSQNPTAHTIKVTVLGTKTGQPLATLSAERSNTNGAATMTGVPYTAWSPNGQQLAFVDYYSSRVTIWGGVSLAALSH